MSVSSPSNLSESNISVYKDEGAPTKKHDEVAKPHAEHAEHLDRPGGAYRATGDVDNLLAPLTRKELFQHVDSFVDEYHLEDIRDIMRRGALVAQRPKDFENIPELTPDEKAALKFEEDHKWRQPLAMYLTIILCSIGACVQGWDQTGASGANLQFPSEFGIPITDTSDPNYEHNNWIVGLINSAPFITAFSMSAWLTDPLNHYIGRRGTLFLGSIFCIAAPIGSAFTHNWWELFIARLVLGFGIGFKETIAPILAAENAPTRIRGALVMMWQMWTAFGICIGYAANLVVMDTGKIAWRLMLGSAMIPAVPLLLLVFLVPESPRWYIRKRKIRSAWTSLCRLRHNKILAARDLYYIYVQIVEEDASTGDTNYFQRFGQLFYKNRLRQATLASGVVMIAQQMCGINIIAFFSSSIFAQVASGTEKVRNKKAMEASFGYGLINWLFSIPAFFTIDTFGRRALLLFTFPQMFWTLLAAGFSNFAKDDTTRLALVALFVYLFTAFYSPGEGPVPFTYSAEVFPLSHREVGMAWAVTVNNLFLFLLSLTFFRLEIAFTVVGAFGFYAGLNVLAFVWIFLWVPETKQLSLEELDFVFSVPTTTFMKYQFEYSLPYFFKRYIFREKVAPPPPVYEINRGKAFGHGLEAIRTGDA